MKEIRYFLPVAGSTDRNPLPFRGNRTPQESDSGAFDGAIGMMTPTGT